MISKDNLSINGLVLAGGKSTRMKQDKGLINWHGKEQRYYMADLLQKYCKDVLISCRQEQVDGILSSYHVIPDQYELGPFGAILTALEHDPVCAWLVVACDLPLVDEQAIECLIANRNRDVMATTFVSPFDGLPEPLITIWEPSALKVYTEYFSEQKSCPRKLLLNHPVHMIQPLNPDWLLNANTPDDVLRVREILITH